MSKQILDSKQGFSIEELEDRHELTVVMPSENLEAGDRQEGGDAEGDGSTGGNGGDFGRCGGNSNDMGPQ